MVYVYCFFVLMFNVGYMFMIFKGYKLFFLNIVFSLFLVCDLYRVEIY